MLNIQSSLHLLSQRQNLTREQMQSVMREIMSGQCEDAQIGGFLMALATKGETPEEILGAAMVMRSLATPVKLSSCEHLVDTCGTGGDGASIFNVSTASAFVVAAAGGRVAKHGNRSVSSTSGSADVLMAAGMNLDLTPEQTARAIEELGVGFMFAPRHHSAMRHAVSVRQALAHRTVFNLLGPLTNPAGARRQVLGVFDRRWLRPMAQVLDGLGAEHAMIVHAADGLDEISPEGPTFVAELKQGDIKEYEICPEDLGVQQQPVTSLCVKSPEDSLKLIRAAFSGSHLGANAAVALNAGAGIYVAGLADTLKEAVSMAEDAMGSGMAGAKLQELVDFSNSLDQVSA
jgi:anthranilate phosphoribosyltransferase